MSPSADLHGQLANAAAADPATPLRLAALLWSACPEEALERAARSEHPVERLASARHPRTPASAQPGIRSSGREVDALFWLIVVEHLTTLVVRGQEQPWESLEQASRALARLAAAGELIDTASFAIGRDLMEAAAPATPLERLVELGLHPLPLVTARLLCRRDLPEAGELGMTVAGAHPIILEKLALRSRSSLTLAKVAERGERAIEREVMANPYLHLDTLAELAARGRFPTSELARNPALTPELQLQLARRRYKGADAFFQGQGERTIAEALARNPRCTPETLSVLLERPGLLRRDDEAAAPADVYIRRSLAANPRTSPALLRAWAEEAEPGVLFQLAANPTAPPSLLTSLALTRDWSTASAAARNPSCPREALERVVAGDTASIRGTLFENPACDLVLLEQAFCALVEDQLFESSMVQKARDGIWLRTHPTSTCSTEGRRA